MSGTPVPQTDVPTESGERVDIVREGDVFTTTPSTSSLLIEGAASINVDSLQDLQFSSYGGASQSSQINLFGRGIEEASSSPNVELTVTEFNNVTINVFDGQRSSAGAESVISLPIVVSEVSLFEINNGYSQSDGQTEIAIKSIKAPTKTADFTSHVSSNSHLRVQQVSFSTTSDCQDRLHQVVASHSKSSPAGVDSLLVSENVDAELVNFTVKAKIHISQNSGLTLKQTAVKYGTVVEFDVDSIDEVGQISLENSMVLNSIDFGSYQFSPNRIKLNMRDNSVTGKKRAIIKGITEENCNQMFVSFFPQKNALGEIYRSSCEENQLFVSVGKENKESNEKPSKMSNGVVVAIVIACVAALAAVAAVIYFRAKKATNPIIDPSDTFENIPGTSQERIYN